MASPQLCPTHSTIPHGKRTAVYARVSTADQSYGRELLGFMWAIAVELEREPVATAAA